ncbi:hypothetical protein BJX70DRAFT_355023 [Aspergillus crustosus]
MESQQRSIKQHDNLLCSPDSSVRAKFGELKTQVRRGRRGDEAACPAAEVRV